MMYQNYTLIVITLISMCSNRLIGQKSILKEFQWNNRVVLILTDEVDDKYTNQIQEFKNGNYEELVERKIVLIEVQRGDFQISHPGINGFEKSTWRPADGKLRNFLTHDDDFKVVLIGLDGGVKMNQRALISRTELFDTIDSMPMRRAEIKNR